MSDSLIQFPAIASGASFAGTCLMHTIMFTETILSDFRISRGTRRTARERGSIENFYFPDHRLKISAALVPPNPNEFESAYSTSLARVIRNIVQVALRVRIFKIDGRRQNLIAQRQRADAGFQAARAAQ